jgi:uncharacterized protein with ATP-grasp and redox domains
VRKIINTNIRFDLKREDDRQAYENLRRMDRKKFKSYTRAVVAALNDFFSRQEKRQTDPYLETREKENRFLGQVLDTIRAGIQENMSQLPAASSAKPAHVELKAEEYADPGGIDGENYEIAEAFLKDMGL